MWMCYIKDIEITDIKSGVQHLIQKFRNLQFDAEHEAVYGMGRFLSEEECNELGAKYGKGVDICKRFLKGRICEGCLVDELIALGLGDFVYHLQPYLSPNSLCTLKAEELDSDEETDEEVSEDNIDSK